MISTTPTTTPQPPAFGQAMTRDEILSMALEAGYPTEDMIPVDSLTRFAEVVVQRERTSRQAAQLRIEELQALLVRADAERCAAVLNAEKQWRKVVIAAVDLACSELFDPSTSSQDEALEQALIEAWMIRRADHATDAGGVE